MGYNAFQWIDFDGDGRKDIIAVAGNNMEMLDPPLKPLHGVYIYLQTGPMEFSQAHFLRMDGATKALVADYDRDGDGDVAAISAYPDWRAREPAAFVLFANEGGGKFSPATIAPEYSGQPITLDAGDLDGDGDVDLVLGGASWAPALDEPLLTRASRRIARAPAVVLLRNRAGDER
ncbi:MAG: VCBS repeat-containing protein [Pirellulales bacterium]|nr:VCBS repeat-containing protein [Pirellulales bacterium]